MTIMQVWKIRAKHEFRFLVKPNRCPAISYRCVRISRSPWSIASKKFSLACIRIKRGRKSYDKPMVRQNLICSREARKWSDESSWNCIAPGAVNNRRPVQVAVATRMALGSKTRSTETVRFADKNHHPSLPHPPKADQPQAHGRGYLIDTARLSRRSAPGEEPELLLTQARTHQ